MKQSFAPTPITGGRTAIAANAQEHWTADQCAEYLHIKRNTWSSYVRRPSKTNPAPKPLRHIGRTPLWDAAKVQEFGANRSRSAPHTR